jgi:hypothetical protein
MGGNMVGGYLIFPSSLTRADLIAVTLKAMELEPDEFEARLPDDGYPRFPSDGFPFRTEQPPARALALLAQEESGVINGKGSKSPETYWFEPAIESHPLVTCWVYDTAMIYDTRPNEVDNYAGRWLQLCEQGQALFGYFGPFEHMFDRDFLEEKIWPAFKSGDARLVLKAVTPSWLMYLGSERAERWRQDEKPSPSPLLVSQDLPSGAHFFRTTLDVSESSLSDFMER